jgi:ribosome-associated toxin RatA of RatAB toxin-antitoxin module
MAQIQKSALLWYSAQQMYALVIDVDAYPQFLPWCRAAEVHDESSHAMHATLHIDYRGLKQSFTTRNAHKPGERIDMQLEQGPFSQLQGQWRFVPLAKDACRVEFDLVYRFASAALEAVAGPVFGAIASTMVDSFVKRAEAVYGES